MTWTAPGSLSGDWLTGPTSWAESSMTYTRSLLQSITDEREKYGEPLYTTLKCLCVAIINLEHRVENATSRQQTEAETFWRLLELARELPPLVGQNVPHQPGEAEAAGRPESGAEVPR